MARILGKTILPVPVFQQQDAQGALSHSPEVRGLKKNLTVILRKLFQ